MSNLQQSMRQAVSKNGLILGLFALVSTGLIAITHLITKDIIASEIEAAMARQLNEIIPASEYDNDVYHDCKTVRDIKLLGSEKTLNVYRMRKHQENYAVFLTSIAPDGYAGKIKLVLGIYENGEIAGVRVTEHQETPGLGDKIEISKSNWITQFNQKSLNNLPIESWKVQKDGGQFDSLTGATITPRAIIKSVKNSLIFFKKNKENLFALNTNCTK